MMRGTPLKPGTKIPGLPSEPWNAMLRLLGKGGGDPGAAGLNLGGQLRVGIRNGTGTARPEFAVVSLGAPTFTLSATFPEQFKRHNVYELLPPAAGAAFGILQQPLKVDELGPAVVQGETFATLNVTAEADTHAGPAAGDYADLRTATTGPARILWKEAGTGPGKRARVLIGQGGSGSDGAPGGGGGGGTTPAPIVGVMVASITGTHPEGSPGVNNVITDLNVLTLPAPGLYLLLWNLWLDFEADKAVIMEMQEEVYALGPAVNSLTFKGPGAGASGAAPGSLAGQLNRAHWRKADPFDGRDREVLNLATYAETTAENVRLGFRIVYGAAYTVATVAGGNPARTSITALPLTGIGGGGGTTVTVADTASVDLTFSGGVLSADVLKVDGGAW